MKVAVCLVVKDEDVEIIYWIAWYKALGFDSFIIYDDYSDDKTENVILSLKNEVDIRYIRNAENSDMHLLRQLRAYNDAVSRYKNDFDWIALFDADEYLDLDGRDIKNYLRNFEDNISSIAFNWCCVGTNGFINRPGGAPFLNYTRHGSNQLYWNRHTKVIFKPSRLKKDIYNVHNVIVNGICVASSGKPIEWTNEHGGFTKESPTWIGGKLLHYQSRSLEHYVKRHKNLEEIRYKAGDPLHSITNNNDYNEIKYSLSESYLRNFYKIMYRFAMAQNHFIIDKLLSTPIDFIYMLQKQLLPVRTDVFNPVYQAKSHEIQNHWVSYYKKVENLFENFQNRDFFVFNIINHFGKKLGVKNHKLVASGDIDSDILGVYVKGSNHIHILSKSNDCFSIQGDDRITAIYTYEVWGNKSERFALSHPRKKRFLSFSDKGEQTVNRVRAFEWESFKFQLVDNSDVPNSILDIGTYLFLVKNIQAMKAYYLLNGNKHSELNLNVINTLPKNELDTINLLSGNIINEHLY